MLLAYETLMRRNAQSARPPSAVQLPVIVVGFKSSISGASNMSLDGKSLEIHASENPLFYSPMDVFERIPLPAADQIDALRQFPALASLEAALFA
jgi:hypothetical protein